MQEQLQSIYLCISLQRINKYQIAGIEKLDLYKWNISLSESLYPLLQTIEVALRNRLHTVIADLFNDQNWILNKNKEILNRLDEHWIKKIEIGINALRKKQKLDEGHLIAELSFGFWTALLSGTFEYKQLLWPKLKTKAFPNATGLSIDHIRKCFDQIRSLRNRVFHYGSIWSRGDLNEQHNLIIEAIQWIEPSLLILVKVDRFTSIYNKYFNIIIKNKHKKETIYN